MSSEENNKKGRNVLVRLLRTGETVDVPASGLSMFPFLLPTDVLRVRPVSAENLKRGQIIVYENFQKIISHRYIKTKDSKVICKGDGLLHIDQPFDPASVLGVVVARTRKGRTLNLETNFFFVTGRIMSYVTGFTGIFFHYLGRAWYKWIFTKKV